MATPDCGRQSPCAALPSPEYNEPRREKVMAKGQKKSNKEARKPKAEVKKTIAANPSTRSSTSTGTIGDKAAGR
jgi:hypothetical protein